MGPAAALATILWAQLAGAAPSDGEPAAAPVVTAPAAPASVPVELRWDAPAGCPDAASVRAGIARGLPPSPAGAEVMHADVVVSALDAGHWRAALALRGADWTATRALRGPTCAAVADAAGLVIVLALASELQAHEIVVAPPPAPSPPPARVDSTPAVALAFTGDVGSLPAATAGGALSLGWRFPRARVELRGGLFASRTGDIAGAPDTGGRLSLASLDARGCYLRGVTLSLGPCLGAGLDRLRGTPTGPIATPTSVTNLAPFLEGGLQAEWRLSRWVVPFVRLEAAIPLVRARFSVEDVGQIHQSTAVLLRGALGLELRFR